GGLGVRRRVADLGAAAAVLEVTEHAGLAAVHLVAVAVLGAEVAGRQVAGVGAAGDGVLVRAGIAAPAAVGRIDVGVDLAAVGEVLVAVGPALLAGAADACATLALAARVRAGTDGAAGAAIQAVLRGVETLSTTALERRVAARGAA